MKRQDWEFVLYTVVAYGAFKLLRHRKILVPWTYRTVGTASIAIGNRFRNFGTRTIDAYLDSIGKVE